MCVCVLVCACLCVCRIHRLLTKCSHLVTQCRFADNMIACPMVDSPSPSAAVITGQGHTHIHSCRVSLCSSHYMKLIGRLGHQCMHNCHVGVCSWRVGTLPCPTGQALHCIMVFMSGSREVSKYVDV